MKPKLIKTVSAMTFRLNSKVMLRLMRMTQYMQMHSTMVAMMMADVRK